MGSEYACQGEKKLNLAVSNQNALAARKRPGAMALRAASWLAAA